MDYWLATTTYTCRQFPDFPHFSYTGVSEWADVLLLWAYIIISTTEYSTLTEQVSKWRKICTYLCNHSYLF